MPDTEMFGFYFCFGFVLFLIPTIICIVLAVRLAGLRDRVNQLERRLADLARDLFVRPRAPAPPLARAPAESRQVTAPHVPPTAPIPLEPEQATPAADAHATPESLASKKEQLHQMIEHAGTPPVTPVASSAPAVASPSSVPPLQAHPAPAPAAPAPPHVPARPPALPSAAPAAWRPYVPPAAPVAKAPAKRRSLEFYIIAAFIVIGAITLSLAAIFLVKIGIEKGVFGPLLRDWASAIAALILIGVGQWRRRFEAFWSQGLTAAGIVALFAAVFAATSVHHFLTPIEGFMLLGATTAGAVAMSLQDWSGARGEGGPPRGGMLIAALGLIGGFITPILVNTGRDDVPSLFGYLILLHVGLIFATRIRGWTILAAASVVLSSLWLIFWTLFKWNPVAHGADGPILGMFMLATVVTLVISTITRPEKWRGGTAGLAATVLSWLGVGLGLLAACILLGKSQYDDLQWAFFAMLVAGGFVLARLRPVYEAMAWLASFTVLAMLTAWGVGLGAPPQGIEGSHAALAFAAEHLRFQTWLLGLGVSTVLAAFACQWKSAAPIRWALLANILTLAYVVVGYWLVPALPRADAWGWLPVAAAGGLAVLMIPLLLRRDRIVTGEACLVAYAHGILVLLLMAAPMGLSGSQLTAAWAALLPLAALAVWRLKLPGLCAGILAVAFIVGMRAMMIHAVFDAGGAGRTLWWNPVIWSYGTLLVAMGLTAFILERCADLPERWRGTIPGPKVLSALMQAGAACAGFLLLSLEVRWGFHNGQLDADSALLAERGTFALGWLLLAAALVWIGQQTRQRVLLLAGEFVAILGMVYAVVGLVVLTNPLWWQWQGVADDVGGIRFFNMLLFAYGMPAAACALLAYVIGRADPEHRGIATASAAAGIVLLFALVSLQVRQGFVGADLALDHAAVGFREVAAYAMAWLALGSLCLAVGRRFRRDVLWRGGIWIATLAILYAVIVVGIFVTPLVNHIPVGPHAIFNDLLLAYGVPVILAALAAWIVDSRAQRLLGPLPEEDHRTAARAAGLGIVLRIGIVALALILTTTEVRQAFQHTYLDAAQMAFWERATYSTAWLALAGVLLTLGASFHSQISRRSGLILLGMGMGWAIAICALLANPMLMRESVGSVRVFNGLLYAYGLPALAGGILAGLLWYRTPWAGTGLTERIAAWICAIAALLLVFILVTLEVQQWFRGDHLALSPPVPGEFVAYSLAWASLGIVYLAAGIWRKSILLRWASLVMMLITIPKVFLLDMPALQDFQRVLSFTGLGVSLMILGFVYFRFVFPRPAPAVAASTQPPVAQGQSEGVTR